jgi:hypothetical protein
MKIHTRVALLKTYKNQRGEPLSLSEGINDVIKQLEDSPNIEEIVDIDIKYQCTDIFDSALVVYRFIRNP